jgi:hypothetical protein
LVWNKGVLKSTKAEPVGRNQRKRF